MARERKHMKQHQMLMVLVAAFTLSSHVFAAEQQKPQSSGIVQCAAELQLWALDWKNNLLSNAINALKCKRTLSYVCCCCCRFKQQDRQALDLLEKDQHRTQAGLAGLKEKTE